MIFHLELRAGRQARFFLASFFLARRTSQQESWLAATWRTHSCVPRRDSLENPPAQAAASRVTLYPWASSLRPLQFSSSVVRRSACPLVSALGPQHRPTSRYDITGIVIVTCSPQRGIQAKVGSRSARNPGNSACGPSE